MVTFTKELKRIPRGDVPKTVAEIEALMAGAA